MMHKILKGRIWKLTQYFFLMGRSSHISKQELEINIYVLSENKWDSFGNLIEWLSLVLKNFKIAFKYLNISKAALTINRQSNRLTEKENNWIKLYFCKFVPKHYWYKEIKHLKLLTIFSWISTETYPIVKGIENR